MSPRDYKHAAPRATPREANSPRYGSWVSFVSGLGFGLVVAFGVYLWSASLPQPDELVEEARALTAPARHGEAPVATEEEVADLPAQPYEAPRPTFDFYKILPEMEVPVPEWESEAEAAAAAAAAEEASKVETSPDGNESAYVLQVGSFKTFDDAEAAKANLALRGISASVQRVVINGQEVWFRVHIGPLSDAATLRAIRMKLTELDISFILLKLGGESKASAAAPAAAR